VLLNLQTRPVRPGQLFRESYLHFSRRSIGAIGRKAPSVWADGEPGGGGSYTSIREGAIGEKVREGKRGFQKSSTGGFKKRLW